MNAGGDDLGPSQNNRWPMLFFYVIFIVIFPFFFNNVFIAFVILTFQSEGDAQLLKVGLTQTQVSLNKFFMC